MEYSRRLARVPDSYFGKTMGQEVKHGLLPLINMAVGVPDGETPRGILDTFAEALYQPENQKYGAFHGKATFKQAIVQFYKRHYDVDLDPEEEVCILYGTKNGLVGLPTSIVNPGENVLLPDPGYTDYLAGVLLADAVPVPLQLDPPHYLPDWTRVPSDIMSNTKLVYLTYPNNPTGSVATLETFEEAVQLLKVPQLESYMTLPIVPLVSMRRTLAYSSRGRQRCRNRNLLAIKRIQYVRISCGLRCRK